MSPHIQDDGSMCAAISVGGDGSSGAGGASPPQLRPPAPGPELLHPSSADHLAPDCCLRHRGLLPCSGGYKWVASSISHVSLTFINIH